MANLIDAITNPLKSASDTAKKLVSIRDTAKFGDAVIELQAQIMAAQQGALVAQSGQFSLIERIRELEEKVTRLETWDAEKQRYRLKDFGGGTFAYELKPGMQGDDPPHRICANCFQNNHKSILQFRFNNTMSQDVYVCPSCEHEFNFGQPIDPPILVAESDHDP